jgi:excisionase family DNA binding protein
MNRKPKNQDALLTVKEAATELGVCPATVRRWIGESRIAVVYLPGRLPRLKTSTVETIRLERADNSQPDSVDNLSHAADPLLTPNQAAVMLGVSTSTVRNWIADKLIPYIRLPGGFFRIRQSRIDGLFREVQANKTNEFRTTSEQAKSK